MKKLFTVLLTLLVLFTLGACKKEAQIVDEDLQDYKYDDITLTLPVGMTQDELEGFDVFMYNDDFMASAFKEDRELFESAGLDFDSYDLEGYAKLVEETNGIDAFSEDECGNLGVSYVREVQGNDFYYYTVVKQGTDAFWVVTFSCLKENQVIYQFKFQNYGLFVEVK